MRVSEHCYAVTGLAYALPWVVNTGFIVGDTETLVVDTGANALAAATIHGYAVAVGRSNRVCVINTEKHFDHIGGNSFFRALGSPIYGHPNILRTSVEFDSERSEFHPTFHHATALANPDHAVEEGTQFDLGSCRAEVLITPGHTSTNISVYVPDDRVLYCGDCLTNLYAPNLDAANGLADWHIWLKSLDRIEALAPHVIVCGHGPVVQETEVASVIASVRSAINQRVAAALAPPLS